MIMIMGIIIIIIIMIFIIMISSTVPLSGFSIIIIFMISSTAPPSQSASAAAASSSSSASASASSSSASSSSSSSLKKVYLSHPLRDSFCMGICVVRACPSRRCLDLLSRRMCRFEDKLIMKEQCLCVHESRSTLLSHPTPPVTDHERAVPVSAGQQER